MDREIVPHTVLGASAVRRPLQAMNVPMPDEVLWLTGQRGFGVQL